MLGTLRLAGVLALGTMLMGCAAETTPLDPRDQEAGPAKSTEVETSTFEVRLRGDTTSDTVIPQIVAAAHDRLTVACESRPNTSVRIYNPLAKEPSVAEVPCSTFLDGIGESSAALTSEVDGPIGTVQQKWSPVGLVCSAVVLGATLAWNWPWGQEGCNNPKAEDQTACRAITGLGGGGLGLLCSLI